MPNTFDEAEWDGTFDWPEWLDSARNDLSEIYWATKDMRPPVPKVELTGTPILKEKIPHTLILDELLFLLLHKISKIEQVYLEEEVSELCEDIFKYFVETDLAALQLEQETATKNLQKDKERSHMLREMTKLIEANPELLEQESNTKLAKALNEASPHKAEFYREYVRKYRARVKRFLRL
jgi:hypothetical protein